MQGEPYRRTQRQHPKAKATPVHHHPEARSCPDFSQSAPPPPNHPSLQPFIPILLLPAKQTRAFKRALKGLRSRIGWWHFCQSGSCYLEKLAVFIVANLPAALQLALNQQYLLIARQT